MIAGEVAWMINLWLRPHYILAVMGKRSAFTNSVTVALGIALGPIAIILFMFTMIGDDSDG
jgi:hypothetical protein